MSLVTTYTPLITVEKMFSQVEKMVSQLEKIRRVKSMIGDRNIELQVDGGVNVDNIKPIVNAGATVLVAGSAVFNEIDYRAAIEGLQKAAG